jgi:acylphosphatase
MRKRFVVHGRVQGVFFRTTAAEEARRLRVTGRIWNRDDGAVECIAEGEIDAVERFRQWLGHGPPRARVERVDAADVEGSPRYADFRIAREA